MINRKRLLSSAKQQQSILNSCGYTGGLSPCYNAMEVIIIEVHKCEGRASA